jgi:chromosome segregation ATPase
MLKADSKLSKKTLGSALKEFSELQSHLKSALSEEARAHTGHTKALAAAAKAEAAYHNAKTKWEKEKAEVVGKEGGLESAKARSKQAKARADVARKEVEELRKSKGVEEVRLPNAGEILGLTQCHLVGD